MTNTSDGPQQSMMPSFKGCLRGLRLGNDTTHFYFYLREAVVNLLEPVLKFVESFRAPTASAMISA